MLYIGIDGGGTHSSAVAVRPDGRILSRAAGPGLNYLNIGLEACLARFSALIRPLLPADPDESVVICAGLAALDGPAAPDILEAFRSAVPSGVRLLLNSDLAVALAGLTRGEPGLMAVCGTGSMTLVRSASGEERVAGGWGWKLGDPGSGYSLAREGLSHALFRLETEGIETPLLAAARTYFSLEDPRALANSFYASEAGPDALAAFGAEVVHLAEQGDPEALEILTRQMDQFSALSAALLQAVPEARAHVGLYGGVFQHSALARSLFSRALWNRCPDTVPVLPDHPPALGAVILAMLQEGIASDLPYFTE